MPTRKPHNAAMSIDRQKLIAQFEAVFGKAINPVVVRSPGRVNLIGEHTDYNEGLVFPMAIEPAIYFVAQTRSDDLVRVFSSAMKNSLPVEFRVASNIPRVESHGDAAFWTNYVRGPVAQLVRAGTKLGGMDLFVHNTLPAGSGLSSSAAMEIGTSVCALKLITADVDRVKLALLNVDGEHEYPQVPCGVMDQMIVANGRSGHAMQLDCRGNKIVHVPLPSDRISVVIVNTMVKHALADGGYAKRKMQCEVAVKLLQTKNPGVKSLRDVSGEMLEQLRKADAVKAVSIYGQIRAREKMSVEAIEHDEEFRNAVFRRARHVVTENHRTQQFAIELEQSNFEEAGQLMLQSHNSLRYDYNVTVNELDFLVETSMAKVGVFGCRMTGGGFGGCVVALVEPNEVDPFQDEISKAYQRQFNIVPQVIVTAAADGTSVVL